MIIIEALLDHTPHCAQSFCDQYFTEQMQNSGKCAGNELKIWTSTATLYPPLSILTYILMRILTKMPPHILKVTFYFLTMILVF